MGWASFVAAYVLGGITFLPLVLVAVLLHAHLTLPRREDAAPPSEDAADSIVQPGDDVAALEAAQKAQREEKLLRPNLEPDVASGYFAVCREYTPMGINAKPIERSTPVGSTTVAAPSQSVYQAMYKSLFDRKPTPGPLDDRSNANVSQRPRKAGNVFYVVLRHGHLMLFDDDEQLEVRHVISLSHHDISIYSGGDVTPEGELFIKRNALCLSRRRDGPEIGPDSQLSKPFYLFAENCSAKEDFYFSLLRNQEQTFAADRKSPTPLHFDVQNIINLVQRLHSTDEHIHTRWLNALLGRVFLGVYKTRDLESFIMEKITKKISRVKRPSFLSGITIRKIDTGDSAPYVTNPRLRDLTVEGECVAEADVRYTGNFRIEVAAKARIDLGARFKVREVDLVLAVVVRKVEGHVLFKIKPPPSNRIWFSFQAMPKLEMTIEPIVSARQITYTLILRQIENRIKEVVAETLVFPFWDDVPFFRTEHKKWRGGVFEDDTIAPSEDAETVAAQEGDVDAVRKMEEPAVESPGMVPLEKSHTLPVIENSRPTGLFGRKLTPKSSASSNASATALATGFDGSGGGANTTRQSDQLAELDLPDGFAPSDSTLEPLARPAAVFHRASNASSSASSRDNTDGEGDKDRTPTAQDRRNTASSVESSAHSEATATSSPAPSIKDSLRSHTGSISRGLFRRDNTANLASSGALGNGNEGAQKRNTLAAVTKAAVQARNWGWNALQRGGAGPGGPDGGRGEGASKSEASSAPNISASGVDLSQPMGRGRPLPPPGTPLPPPERGSRVTSIPVPKRKTVLPPPTAHNSGDAAPDDRPSLRADHRRPSAVAHHASSGEREERLRHRRSQQQLQPEELRSEQRRPVPPPPLPKRRHVEPASEADESGHNMLVVAAPVDSEPGTPLTEDAPPLRFRPAPSEILGRPEMTAVPTAVAGEQSEDAPEDFAEETPQEPVPGDSDTAPARSLGEGLLDDSHQTESSRSAANEEEDYREADLQSPITAVPVVLDSSEDDDDGYSPWMDSMGMESDVMAPESEEHVSHGMSSTAA